MGEFNDMERFYDTCQDNRTEKQIQWEEGTYKNGSLRDKWDYHFGKGGFYKFGKKIASMLILMALWVCADICVGNSAVNFGLHIIMVLAVNIASVWLYRQSINKGFTGINYFYFVFCVLFSIAFYKYMSLFFGYIGHSMFLSLYYGTYLMGGIVAVILRFGISVYIIYSIVTSCEKEEILNGAVAVIAVIYGLIYKYFLVNIQTFYILGVVFSGLLIIIGSALYYKKRNKFLRNIILIFAFVGLMEIIGSNSVISGVMENYIENGVF